MILNGNSMDSMLAGASRHKRQLQQEWHELETTGKKNKG